MKLSSVDAAWLRMDGPTSPMIIAGFLELAAPVQPEQLALLLDERLLCFARFRQRVVESRIPLQLPRWQDDRDFDLNRHVIRLELETTDEAGWILDDLVSAPLDRAHPLWQVHLLELPGGRTLAFFRLHHCIGDGFALASLLAALSDERSPSGPLRGAAARAPPSRVRGVGERAARYAGAAGRLLAPPPAGPAGLAAPPGRHRRVAWSDTLALERVMAVARPLDATANDVLIAVAAGALRRYLLERGERSDALAIRAVLPVNLRPPGAAPRLCNQVGLALVDLPVAVAGAVARVLATRRILAQLADGIEPRLGLAVLRGLGHIPPALQPRVARYLSARSGVVLGCVPGPERLLWLLGQPIRRAIFWVPQAGGLGLGLSILRYAGGVGIGVIADADRIPDPWAVVVQFEREAATLGLS